jgi:hypothetical protein
MQCNPFSPSASPATKRYNRGIALTMTGYVFAVVGTTIFVKNNHPHGLIVYFLSVPPSLCIFAMLGVVITYLRDESDEYQRMLFVRSLLAAAFITLAVGAYTDFLRIYGAIAELPAFAQFVCFWFVFGIAQAVQSMGDRIRE